MFFYFNAIVTIRYFTIIDNKNSYLDKDKILQAKFAKIFISIQTARFKILKKSQFFTSANYLD